MSRKNCMTNFLAFLHRPIVIQRLLSSASVVGFTAQVIQVSILYFGYRTTTQVKIQTPADITTHAVALCIRYIDIVNREALKKDTGLEFRPLIELRDGIEQEDLLTVEQVFKYTPHEDALLSECFTRPDEWRYSFRNGPDCYNVFNVSRFMTLEYMCYRVSERIETNLTVLSVTHASFQQYKIYEIKLGPTLRSTVLVIPIVYSDGYPFLSRDYTSPLPQLRVSRLDNFTYNVLHVFPSDFLFFRLPPPFDTLCHEAVQGYDRYCNKECLIKEFGKFDRVPGFEMLEHPYKLKVFSVKDLNDTSLLRKATDSFLRCRKKCFYTPCQDKFSSTTSRVMKDGGMDIKLSLLTSINPNIIIIAQATMVFIEYFSFVTGCFGTWFGWSFLSLNRFKLLSRRRNAVKAGMSVILPNSSLTHSHEPWRLRVCKQSSASITH